VREAAQLLGLCLDSVRRQLRAGKLQGVRVGRDLRVPERVLLAQLGLAARNDELPVGLAPAPLPNGMTRQEIKTLVHKAAQHADLSHRNTQRLLAELDDLLPA